MKQGQAQSLLEWFRKADPHGPYGCGICFHTALRFVLFHACVAIGLFIYFYFSLLSHCCLRNL